MRRHDRMGRGYLGGKSERGKAMRGHCRSISDEYSKVAEEYDALAKLFDEEAKQAE
jgi:hypothetical protein